MNTTLLGAFADPIILQISHPKIVNVAAVDYVAESINKNTGTIDPDASVIPFVICHPEQITLKVETWFGTIITWTFSEGPYPMPLRKIFFDGANSTTTVQIGY